MASIIVNNKLEVKGKLSVDRVINETKDGFIITGLFATHNYIEEIYSLSTPRFNITGIEVYRETFGSDDYDIAYHFTAKNLSLKDYMDPSLGFNVGYILLPEEEEAIEKIMYKNDHKVLGDIGEEYKDIYTRDDKEEE